jgi:hypothetical protein
MDIQILVLVMLGIFPLRGDSYTLGVENGSKFDVDDVKLISKEIRFSRELGHIPAAINKKVIVRDRVPRQVVVEWRREDKHFSVVIPIPQDVRQRVVDESRLYVRILDDDKAAAYVEITYPLDLRKRTYYPPEFAPKEDETP